MSPKSCPSSLFGKVSPSANLHPLSIAHVRHQFLSDPIRLIDCMPGSDVSGRGGADQREGGGEKIGGAVEGERWGMEVVDGEGGREGGKG